MHAERASEAHHDTSPPVRDLQGAPTESQSHPALRDRSGRDSGASSGDTSGRPLPGRPGARPRVRVGGIGANGSAPPDNDGAVGATQYVELVNSQFAVYDKSGNTVLAARNTNTIWSGFGGGCQANNDGDGTVLYDAMAGRWVIQQFSVTGSSSTGSPYLDCVAVSTTSDATGSWNRYSFQYTNFPDYPKTGVWPDAYYASFNLFNDAGTSGLGAELCAFNRSAMLAGAAATQQCFMATSSGENTFLPASVDGTTAPPAGEPEHFVALGTTSANALSYVNFHVDWSNTANSSLSAITDLAVTAFSRACNGGGTCVPQSGTSTQLDSLADRLMYRLAYRNFGDHEAMVVNHSVTSGSSVGVRWYELRPSGSALGVYQQGTYAPDATYRWMGSIALDQSGDMALGYSTSSSTTHPGIRYSGRLRADAAGTMSQPETTVITGGGSQTSYNGQRLTRWGDYTEMTVDPVDGCTFWYVNEYIPSNGAFNWATQITSFRYPSCGGTTPPPASNDFSMSANPSSVSTTQGGSATSTIATTVTSGSAQSVSLSASGLPAGATASFAPASVSAGGSSTMTVSTAPTTPAGTSTITVTGTGASATHTTTVSLTVTASAGGGGSVVANGGFESGSLAGWTPGGVLAPVLVASGAHSGTYAAQLGGSSAYNGDSTLQQTIAVPSNGGTLTFWYQPHCPDTITYDQQKAELRSTSGSTLVSMLNVCSNSGAWTQVSQDLSAYKGQSVVLWFGTHDDNYPSDPTSMLLDDVSVGAPAPPPPPPPAGVVVNGGFESGSLSGWTARGASTSVVSGVAHSGTYAARLGSTSPTSGDSTITQTIAVPASGGTLTVWYQPHCPDTLTYDQEQIEVRSTAGTVLATLANVCSNSGTWTKVTQSLSAWAGTSVVIWLNSHDDNYAGDPTYTLFDDISVG